MTLSTRADHEVDRKAEMVADELACDVSPEGSAEEAVMNLEGSECLRPVVDAAWEAMLIGEAVERDAREYAGLYTDSEFIAESVAERFGERAMVEAEMMIRESPAIKVEQ